jgi:hypothetical protein
MLGVIRMISKIKKSIFPILILAVILQGAALHADLKENALWAYENIGKPFAVGAAPQILGSVVIKYLPKKKKARPVKNFISGLTFIYISKDQFKITDQWKEKTNSYEKGITFEWNDPVYWLRLTSWMAGIFAGNSWGQKILKFENMTCVLPEEDDNAGINKE